MPTSPRFIVDTMLGNLARWLRMLGYDTLYSRSFDDWRIIDIASKDDRVIVTRDRGLYARARKRNLNALLIRDLEIHDMLKYISKRLGVRFRFNENDTRCPHCNHPLRKTTSIIEVSGKVDENILKTYREFWICDSCRKVYWKGNHWRNIEYILNKVEYWE